MSEPPPLDYATRHTPGNRPPVHEGQVMLRFLLGLGIGVGISALVWFIVRNIPQGPGRENWVAAAAWVLLGAKFVAGVLFLCLRGWRGLGLGLICSVPLGVLMFFYALCAP